jgi:hypothetical protein
VKSSKDRERLLRIISVCVAIERKGGNPFEVEVKEALETLRKYLPHWKALEDFALDAKTLNRISSIVSLQGNWIKHRSTTLFVDPLLIELKVKMLEPEKLLEIFRRTWHPVIEMDRLSNKRVLEAIDYWNQLQSLEERLMKLPEPTSVLDLTSIEELIKARIVSEESFTGLLQKFWLELKEKAAGEGRIHYWDFIYAPSYEETVVRAYLTSFLVTYGFATMEIEPIEEETFLVPHMEPRELSLKEQMISFPISIDYDLWKEMAEGR